MMTKDVWFLFLKAVLENIFLKHRKHNFCVISVFIVFCVFHKKKKKTGSHVFLILENRNKKQEPKRLKAGGWSW